MIWRDFPLYNSWKGEAIMSYEKPEIKKVEADVSVRNMADDKGECHGGHCVRCIHAFVLCSIHFSRKQ